VVAADSQIDQLQPDYKASVEKWIATIRREEDLASVDHDVAKNDLWEQAHFAEDEMGPKMKAAKKRYEDALREQIYGF